ncbi:P-loop NTPase family protein [Corynebacterium uterequi]|uniref:Uncharacterized protein n=1 Tax=Corynebacterium uterequi TaxID=1072256 RepID=A0A0G3HFC8_9CORY|nr:hypothetical protein [Corynebacterium uterequi]AKK10618.1 hypothetical protein CUTER_03045 [Corynebacterium uterequi]
MDLATLGERELEALRLAKIGYVFQQPQLLEELSLMDNATLPARWTGRQVKLDERFEQLRIARVADAYPAAASGG